MFQGRHTSICLSSSPSAGKHPNTRSLRPTIMICQACLRASRFRGSVTNTLSAHRLLSQAAQRRTVSATIPARFQCARFPRLIHPAELPQRHSPSARRSLFSTSAASSSSAPAQPQEAPTTSTGSLEKPSYLSAGESQVWDRLVAEFAPTQLVVQDISGGCGSMYGIEISSEKFRGLNMLKQQRLVNAALGDLMKDWHGLQLKTRTP
ncbi:hypothetical protein VTK56DRAFT_8923 [Thermocarpiscus australiensis]